VNKSTYFTKLLNIFVLGITLLYITIICTLPVQASNNGISGTAKGTYMSSSKVYATVDGEDDVIGRVVVTCLAQVREIDVDMYLQRGYGNVWKNASASYNMKETDVAELDRSAIIRNVTPGIYRVYIEVTVIGYDGLMDSVSVGTGTITINT